MSIMPNPFDRPVPALGPLKWFNGLDPVPGSFEEALDSVLADLRALMIRKQRDYGNENINAFGEFGVLVRANDKIARLRNMQGKATQPANESVDDSWSDLAGYAFIALMLRRGVWNRPLAETMTPPPNHLIHDGIQHP